MLLYIQLELIGGNIMNVKISRTNEKLGVAIPSVNLPAICTCRKNTPCAKTCYANKGNFKYPKVVKSLNNNLACFVSDKNEYFNDIINYLNNGMTIYKYFRWHASGDIVNADYLEGMIKVAKKCKLTKFLAFTKKFELVNEYLASGRKLPSNLKIVFSAWDKNFEIENPYNLPVAYVNFKNKTKNPSIPHLAIPCGGKCEKCLSCWTLVKGQSVVFDQH